MIGFPLASFGTAASPASTPLTAKISKSSLPSFTVVPALDVSALMMLVSVTVAVVPVLPLVLINKSP